MLVWKCKILNVRSRAQCGWFTAHKYLPQGATDWNSIHWFNPVIHLFQSRDTSAHPSYLWPSSGQSNGGKYKNTSFVSNMPISMWSDWRGNDCCHNSSRQNPRATGTRQCMKYVVILSRFNRFIAWYKNKSFSRFFFSYICYVLLYCISLCDNSWYNIKHNQYKAQQHNCHYKGISTS